MQKGMVTGTHARRFLVLLGLFLLLFSAASLYFDLQGIQTQYINLAAEVGRSFYRAIDTIREWNLDHGGLYVRVDKGTQPNPFLQDPLRDLVTNEGLKLTMINHSHLTRVLSELLTDQRGIHLHIMGLHPIRPENQADDWEQKALARFRKAGDEAYEVTGMDDAAQFRYIAPLKMKPLCLPCHASQEGKEEPTLGGLSVSFSYLPFQRVMARARQRVISMHALFLGMGFLLIAVTGTKLLRSIGELQASLLHIKRLEGFLPICAQCKKIRLAGADHLKQESWVPLELYIEDRTDAEFTHGICPQCAQMLYPDLSLARK